MLHAKNLIAHFYLSNADGPLEVRVYGRYTKDGLVIHGISVDNTYPRGKPQLSLLPRPMDFVPRVLIELRKDLLNGEHIKITTPAGPPSIAVWGGGILKHGPIPNQCTRGYRVEWRPRGRPHGSHDHPTLDQMQEAVRILRQKGDKITTKSILRALGRTHDDARRLNEWLKPHGLTSRTLVDSTL
jgi:hypothetical protein